MATELSELVENKSVMRLAIKRLTSREKEILCMKVFKNMSYAAIGRELNPPIGCQGVRMAFFKIVRKLEFSFRKIAKIQGDA